MTSSQHRCARSTRLTTSSGGWAALAAVAAAAALLASGHSSHAQDSGAKATPPAADDAAAVAKGRDLFADYGCGSCHSLADAGATGHVGPSFDGDASLSHDFVVNRVTHGQGAMPAFGDQLSPEEISDLATYLVKVASK